MLSRNALAALTACIGIALAPPVVADPGTPPPPRPPAPGMKWVPYGPYVSRWTCGQGQNSMEPARSEDCFQMPWPSDWQHRPGATPTGDAWYWWRLVPASRG